MPEIEFKDGTYYWARHEDGSTFVVLYEEGMWFCCAVEHPIDSLEADFDPEKQVICEIKRPDQ